MNFNAEEFLNMLPYMGIGMLSIMIVIGVIIAATMLLNFISGRKK